MEEQEARERRLAIMGEVDDRVRPHGRGMLQRAMVPIGDGTWVATAWFSTSEGGLVDIVALAVHLGGAQLPEGGLSKQVLEKVNLTALREDFVTRQILLQALRAGTDEDDPELLALLQAWLATDEAGDLPSKPDARRAQDAVSRLTHQLRTRRGRTPDDEMADLAIAYLNAQAKAPAEVLIQLQRDYTPRGGKSPTYPATSNRVAKARKEGWLTSPGKGSRGGRTQMGPRLVAWLEQKKKTEGEL